MNTNKPCKPNKAQAHKPYRPHNRHKPHRPHNRSNGGLLPFHIIQTAASGDVGAINQVLKHYEGYIIALSTKRLFDERGRPHMVVDNEMRRTLETNLIVKIMMFDVNRAA